MKQILTSKALRKLLILSCLVVGLVFIAASDNTQSVMARPCCVNCPVYPTGDSNDIVNYCTDQCGASSGSCYNNCYQGAVNCQNACTFSCGVGGGGNSCEFDTQCQPGSFCVNNQCT